MALPIHTLDRVVNHSPRLPATFAANAGTATSQTSAQAQTPEAPSFTAVFAQIAAAAAAAGTTVASTAPGAVQPAAAASATTAANGPAGPLFGPNPWMTDPTGSNPDGTVTHYNPVYFATQQTAQTVAGMLGGQVVQSVQITTAPGSTFQQNQPNYMVQLPNGGLVNPGFIADFYAHGYSQPLINQQIANTVAGAQPALNT